MTTKIESTYYVGINQPYKNVNQVIGTIKNAIDSNDFTLPSEFGPNGGNVSIVIRDNGNFAPIVIPDNLTPILQENNRFLTITRQELTENGELIKNSLPIISPNATDAVNLPIEQRLIGIDIGSNNPNVILRSLRVQDFLIGIRCGFNCHNLKLDRNFVTNCTNTQIYLHDSDSVYLTNNVVIGGEYGIVTQFIRNLRLYHNTVFLDGLTALGGKAKAGVIIQGERTFGNTSPSTIYNLGNLIYTIGCPALVVYEEDTKSQRLVSNYNNLYSETAVVQLRQDNAQLEDEEQIIKANYKTLADWQVSAQLPSVFNINNNFSLIDKDSLSIHPVFIQSIVLASTANTNIIDLTLLANSALTSKVPSWYINDDNKYIPNDFSVSLISIDSLLNTREQPFTSIGANDAISINGFFGQDIFTNPLLLNPDKTCDIDPLNVITSQTIQMNYPAISAGYIYSHERPYYLYAKKEAGQLGNYAITEFSVPGFLDKTSITIKVKNKDIPEANWDLLRDKIILYHSGLNIVSYYDEVQVDASVLGWSNYGFTTEEAHYIYKIKDGETRFVLPETYKASAPVSITDDRISYLNPLDITNREFSVVRENNRNIISWIQPDNLIENSDFSTTYNGLLPAFWDINQLDSDRRVFLVSTEYAYFGDLALGVKGDLTPGYISTDKIDVRNRNFLTFSWHGMLPVDITGQSGVSVTGLDVQYYIDIYDNNKNKLNQSHNGTFTLNNNYQRYYFTLGTEGKQVNTDVFSATSAPITNLGSDTPYVIPDQASNIRLMLSGIRNTTIQSGAFFVLDAIQAEYSEEPSYYHPKPSFEYMTVEFETSNDNIFVDNRMNITPVFNENPNGFLYITDMPASLWNGPDNIEVTTLHDYRWPEGRINVMPWARLFGKDKLKQKIIGDNTLTPTSEIVAPYIFPKKALSAVMSPSVLRVFQGSELPEGLHIQITDDLENAYPLRNYVAHVYELHDNFPGWLSKKSLGYKEQLGSTVYGTLNNNGGLNIEYIPPSDIHIKYVGYTPFPVESADPNVLDKLSYIKTSYTISTENNGNITVIGDYGKFNNTFSNTLITGNYQIETDNNKKLLTLNYPPVFGSVRAFQNNKEFYETQLPPESNQFFVNYQYGQLELAANALEDVNVYVEYLPKYVYPSPEDKNTIVFHHDKVFGIYSGIIQVDYDAEVQLEVKVEQPLNEEFITRFPIILQNPQLFKVQNNNEAFEF